MRFRLLMMVMFSLILMAPFAVAQTGSTVTVNPLIVSGAVWLLGLVLKKIKPLPNDFIPQILNWVSIVSAYLLAIGGAMVGTQVAFALVSPAYAQVSSALPAPLPAGGDSAAAGAVIFTVVTLWDWLGRKVVWAKLLAPLLRKVT